MTVYISRVLMPISEPTSCFEMTGNFKARGIGASLALVDSIKFPGGLDFAVESSSRVEAKRAMKYLESLGWKVGDLEESEGR